MKAITAIIPLAAVIFATATSLEYSYDNQTAWNYLPGSQCGMNMQSPIDVDTDTLEPGDSIGLTALVINYLDDALEGTWSNNGHSLTFTPSSTDGLTIQAYRGTYELAQFHFHWGATNSQGSEHLVDGSAYSGELHFVHKTTRSGASDTDFDYYTVVGVLLRSEDSLEAAGTLWESLSIIPDYQETIILNNTIDVKNMLPDSLYYYYYNGSLTTPVCSQIVQWVLLQNAISVPSSFFTSVRTAPDSEGDPITYNFRNTQPLNNRKVYNSANNSTTTTNNNNNMTNSTNGDDSGAEVVFLPTFVLVFAVMISFFGILVQ